MLSRYNQQMTADIFRDIQSRQVIGILIDPQALYFSRCDLTDNTGE